jgi:anti-anti-sigma factor
VAIGTRIDKQADVGAAVLRVTGELNLDQRPQLLEALEALIACPEGRLVIDLTRTAKLSSIFIGTLIDFAGRAQKADKTVAVMLVSKAAAVCRLIGLEKVAQIVET